MSNRAFYARRLLSGAMLTAAIVSARPAYAQVHDGTAEPEHLVELDPESRVDRRMTFLAQRLDLSYREIASVRGILAHQEERIRASMQASGFGEGRERGERPDPRDADDRDLQLRTELLQIRSDTERELARVLSVDQLSEYRDLEARGARR